LKALINNMGKTVNKREAIEDFIDRTYHTPMDADKTIDGLRKQFKLSSADAIAHLRNFDMQEGNIQAEL
jgi:hypothetical protein